MTCTRRYSSNVKPFENGTLLFLIVHDINTSANDINIDIPNHAFQWKINFNPDLDRQA